MQTETEKTKTVSVTIVALSLGWVVKKAIARERLGRFEILNCYLAFDLSWCWTLGEAAYCCSPERARSLLTYATIKQN